MSSTATPFVTFSVPDLASRVGGELVHARGAEGLPAISGLQTVQDAGPGDLTFIGDDHHAKAWASSKATAAVVSRSLASSVAATDDRAVILVKNADTAMITVLELFAPPADLPAAGVHPSAVVEAGATIGTNARIGPHVTVMHGAVIGNDVTLFAGVTVYPHARIGDGCVLHANVVIRERCVLGRRVILHGGVQIGTDGFGYRPAPDGRGILKVPHLGNVVLEDDVEIGANSCVDRGKFGATLIGMSTKIDNLVQIGHNCRIGRCVVISGLAGIAGSTSIGDGSRIGGGVGVADHLTIGRGVSIAARSGVMNDIPDGETWAGYPAKEARRAMQEVIVTRKLPEYIKNIKELVSQTMGPEAAKILEQGAAKPSGKTTPAASPATLPTTPPATTPATPNGPAGASEPNRG
jgi:UDP-3-O-[3-hydroxymyristoyl] glucosamine N-acyltransferase